MNEVIFFFVEYFIWESVLNSNFFYIKKVGEEKILLYLELILDKRKLFFNLVEFFFDWYCSELNFGNKIK